MEPSSRSVPRPDSHDCHVDSGRAEHYVMVTLVIGMELRTIELSATSQ